MTTASTRADSNSDSILSRLQAACKRSWNKELPLELLEQLHSQLSDEADWLTQGTVEVDNTLFTDPFPLLSLLLPVLSSSPSRSSTSSSARKSLLLLALHSSAKEVVLAVGEKVDELKLPADSDEEEEWDDAHAAEAWDPREASVQLEVMVEMYRIALPRIKTPRPLKFFTPVIEPLVMAIMHLSFEGAFRVPGEASGPTFGSAEDGQEGEDELALGLYEAVARFADTIFGGTWLDKEGENFRVMGTALLTSLLLETTGVLHAFLPSSNLASAFFYARFPRYRTPRTVTTPASPRVEKLWELVNSLLPPLDLSASELLQLTRSPFSSPTTQIGAFVLLTHSHSHTLSPLSPLSLAALDPHPRVARTLSEALGRTLGVLSMPHEQAMLRVGEDERLSWVWRAVERVVEEKGKEGGADGGLEEQVTFPLVELLSTLASLSPSPTTRFLSFRLLSRLLLFALPSSPHSESDDNSDTFLLTMLKSLVSEETPYEQLRTASVGLVKEAVEGKMKVLEENPTSQPSLLLSPLLLSELGSSLFSLPFPLPPPSPSSSSAVPPLKLDEFVSHYYGAVMERLGLYYFLLLRDKENRIGLSTSSVLTHYRSTFLSPLKALLADFLSSPSSPPSTDGHADWTGTTMQLEVVRSMAERIEGVVEEKRRQHEQ
ncbi:hypothetical protein JCM8547_006674 [Rhodosporidiobolus lusitaniae]